MDNMAVTQECWNVKKTNTILAYIISSSKCKLATKSKCFYLLDISIEYPSIIFTFP